VMLPSGISALTPLRISAPPVVYPRSEIDIPRDPMLEDLPAQIDVEPVEDGIGVAGERKVVEED
jgi:hypothetical protein